MSDTKVELYRLGIKGILFNKQDISKDPPYTDFITHDDYRALEDDRDSWRRTSERLEEELAALRGKVGEIESSLQAIASSTSHAYMGIHDPIVGLRAKAREALERFRA